MGSVKSECAIVVDITQTTTFKIQTYTQKAKETNGLSTGESNLFVQKLASADGGSSNGDSSTASGGFGSLSVITDNIDFYTTLPDGILIEMSDGSSAPLYLSHVHPTYYTYQSAEYESYAINFADGTHSSATTSHGESGGASPALVSAVVGHSATMNTSDRSLKYYIENDRAIYYGGGSSSVWWVINIFRFNRYTI